MDQEHNLLKNRLTGAMIWLGLLVIIVPVWYSNPVNFQPGEAINEVQESAIKVVEKPFTISDSSEKPSSETDSTAEPSAEQQIDQQTESEANNDDDSQQAQLGSWIIRVAAFKQEEDAQALQQRLKYDYEAFIKYFPKSQYYSVRIGPYTSRDEATKDQQRLNRVLHIQSELVRIK